MPWLFLRPWIPFRELGEFRRNIDDVLEDLRRRIGYPASGSIALKPPMESFVEERKLIVRAELPGIDPKDITVNVVGNMLTIRASRQEEHETKKRDFVHREFRYGAIERSMTIVGSNGASQAIIDARVLARELALQPSIEAAVAAYDAQRRPATAAAVQANRKVGSSRFLDIVEQRAPDGLTNLAYIISQEELEEISRLYKRTAGFDLEILNNRPSLSVRRGSPRA